MMDWFSSNEAAAQAISSIIQGVAVVALVAVTGVYAYFTRRMARELREQTLAQDRPDLLIDIVEIREPDWYLREAQDEKSRAEVEPYAHHDVACRIHNAGRHAAKEVAVTVMHPNVTFDAPRKGFLLPGDTWEVSVGAHREAPHDEEPCGLIKWRAEQGDHIPKPELPPEPSFPASVVYIPMGDTGVVVCYRDIHDTDWATYLTFRLIKIVAANTGRLVKHEVLVGDQRRIKVKHRRLPPETIWAEPWAQP
jgi:hypothetical protein